MEERARVVVIGGGVVGVSTLYHLAKKGWREPGYAANCPMIFRTRYNFEDEGLFETARGQDLCDLSDHYAVWGWFDYRDQPGASPNCPTPNFSAG